MDEKLAINPEFDGEEITKQDVGQAFDGVLSVPNDPYYFLNKIQRYFAVTSIRDALCRVGGRKELESMLYDPHITAAMDKRKAGIRGARVKFVSDSPEEVAFVEEQLNKDIINHVLKNLWETWFYGYSVDELIWEKDGEGLKIKQIRKVPFYWFNPANDLKSVFYKQQLSAERTLQYDEPATYGKYLLNIKDGTYYRPHGLGVAFTIYFVSKFKEMGWNFWGEWLQKYASGFIIAEVSQDQGSDPKKLQKIKEGLKEAIRGAAIVHKQGNEVRVEWPSSTGDQFKEFRNSAIDDINMTILGETLTSKVESGSQAAATVHDGIQKDKIQLDMELAESAFNRLIEYIYVLNMRDMSNMPEAEVHFEKTLQKERADRDEVVSRFSGRNFSTDYLVNSYGYEETDFAESTGIGSDFVNNELKYKNQEDYSLTGGDVDETFALEDDVEKISDDKDARVDALTDFLNDEAKFGIEAEDIFAAIEASDTPAQLQKNLANFLNTNTDEFEELLTQALFYQFGQGLTDNAD